MDLDIQNDGKRLLKISLGMVFDQMIGGKVPSHITQTFLTEGDDYFIRRRSTHDGSGNFTADVFRDAFSGLIDKTSCAYGSGYDPNIHEIRYETLCPEQGHHKQGAINYPTISYK